MRAGERADASSESGARSTRPAGWSGTRARPAWPPAPPSPGRPRWRPPSHMLNVFRDDVLAAAEAQAGANNRRRAARPAGRAADVAWVMTPPTEGSGGHTTMFRLVGALEAAGHRCVLYLYDRWGGSLDRPHGRDPRVVAVGAGRGARRRAPASRTPTRCSPPPGRPRTPWLARRPRARAVYLVQDFEPSFFPAGGEALLAEATYRFGFHGITAGRVARRQAGRRLRHGRRPLRLRVRPRPTTGSPTRPAGRAHGRVLLRPAEHATPGVRPRRRWPSSVFAARHPDVDIHLFGDPVGQPAVPRHRPRGADARPSWATSTAAASAGLVLSATNVSLVPHEMLAAGCIPVVNDADHNRVVLDNDHVAYAPATPHDLADALVRLVDRPTADIDGRRARRPPPACGRCRGTRPAARSRPSSAALVEEAPHVTGAAEPLVVVGAGGFGRETVEVVRAVNAAHARSPRPAPLGLRRRRSTTTRPVGHRRGGTPASSAPSTRRRPAVGPGRRVHGQLRRTARPSSTSSRRLRPSTRPATPRWSTPRRCCRLVHRRCRARSCSPGVVATVEVSVGAHVGLMPQVVLTHDDVLGDFVTVGVRCPPRRIGVAVGIGAYLGAGCLVREGVRPSAPGPSWAWARSSSTTSPPAEVWAGVPARFLRTVDLPPEVRSA